MTAGGQIMYWISLFPAVIPELQGLRAVSYTHLVNTSSSLVWFVTAIDRPVVVPEDIVPIAITPVIAGASVTTAPGTAVKELFGAVD